jgi:ribosomal protein L23
MPGKEKGAGFVGINKRRRGLTPSWKKAIVTLQAGERIEDFFGAV